MPLPIRFAPSTAAAAALSALALCSALAQQDTPAPARLRFGISFPAARSAEPLDGRIILVISNNDRREPRFENNVYDADTQLAFGIDVDSLRPGQEAFVDGATFGYPLETIADIPPGEYWVQAVLNKYETFHRGDGHVVKLHMDQGEGQHWNTSPGNLYNTPVKVRVDPRADAVIHLSLDQEIPPLPKPNDTKYVKYVRIQSPLLTRFWGRPMYLGAIVLLPEGFDQHPNARYPLMVNHGHFMSELRGFRETPAPNAKGGDPAYEFYKQWTSPGFPRMLMVVVQHANPYYDDSYAVNSENVGPYGDAINRELIPYLEKRFRGIGQGWARGTFGGSTGGWEALATQMFYPDDYNGAWAACPDAIDFRMYEVINIYDEKNAFYNNGDWKKTPHADGRDYYDHLLSVTEEDVHWELVLGTHGRSGDQWNIWQAVYSPVGADGYPKYIWDPMTGEIDHNVAAYWRDHYDLRNILERDWATLGPKLTGKIHLYVGTMDTWHLNNAVYLMEGFLEKAKNPPANAVVEYGDRKPHCWSGHDTAYWFRQLDERIRKTAPKGADLTSWRY
ncbi:MAG TPA: alpha/beta hydrolase-fold protein [Gemmatimonadaceae bacterium]